MIAKLMQKQNSHFYFLLFYKFSFSVADILSDVFHRRFQYISYEDM